MKTASKHEKSYVLAINFLAIRVQKLKHTRNFFTNLVLLMFLLLLIILLPTLNLCDHVI